ncbi:MAG: AAA family ATPase [Sphingopyxis sp.]|uniref:AAA family ATPase n=1 Tax=Sphingopyxis sp. TaxID=1908224 RepID=UPI003D6CE91C
MGKRELIALLSKDLPLELTSSIHLVISDHELAASYLADTDADSINLQITVVGPLAAIPDSAITNASVLIVEVDGANRDSMQRLSRVRSVRPTLPIIVAMRNADVKSARMLVRQGIADVIDLPLVHAELQESVYNILAMQRASDAKRSHLAPVVAVAQSVGGIGATTIATHLAHALGNRNDQGRGCCLIDLDLQFGNAASFVGASAKLTMDELLAAGHRVDGQLVRSVACDGPAGVSVIAAPERIMPIEEVDTEQLLRVINLAREEYDFVVLDLPGNWANWTLSAIAASTVVLLVVELSIGSLKQAKRRIQLFRDTDIGVDRVRIVANRVEKRLFRTINLQDAASALQHDVLASVHSDYQTVQSAHDEGVLVGKVNRKAKVSADLENLGRLVGDILAAGEG